MKTARTLGVRFIALALVMLGVSSALLAQGQATLTFDSRPLTAGVEQRIALNIDCPPAQCSSIRMILRYDPLTLAVSDVEWGAYLGSRDNFVAFDPVIDETAGTITLDLLIYADAGLEDEGELLALVVVPLNAQPVVIAVESITITSSENAETPASFSPTVIEVSSPTATTTAMPTATATLTPRPSPTATQSAAAATDVPPCFALLDETEIYVGPARNRTIRGLLSDRTLRIAGQYTADDGTVWWRLVWPAPPVGEADRFWIIAEDVVSQGGCDALDEASPSAIMTPSVRTPTPSPTVVVPLATVQPMTPSSGSAEPTALPPAGATPTLLPPVLPELVTDTPVPTPPTGTDVGGGGL